MKNNISWKRFGTKLAYFYLVIIILTGCGTRKSEKSHTEFKHDTLSINNNIELRQNSVLFDVFSLRPIDNAKPIIINGISYYNASIKFDKSKFSYLEIKSNESLSFGSTNSETTVKKTDAGNHNFLWIGIAFIIALFVFVWFYLPKLKIN